MEVWLTKLENHLQTSSPDSTKQLLADHEITLTAASYQGGLLLSQGEQRSAHFDQFRKRLDLCEHFEIPILTVVADFVEKVTQTDLERAVVSLTQAAQWASGSGVKIALEFRAENRFCSSLPTALALVAQCPEPNVGVCLDIHHFYTGASKLEDLGLIDPESLAYVQVSDLAGVPRELATDSDRILPGEGDFPLIPIFQMLQQQGYEGWVSLELMNPTLWQIEPSQVVELGYSAIDRLLSGLPVE